MSDVRRVVVLNKMDLRATYDGIVNDPNGTHALMEWEKWERVRSFECCKDAERAPRLEAKVLEQRAEIERLRRVVDEILHSTNPPSDMSGQEVCDWLREIAQRELEESDD